KQYESGVFDEIEKEFSELLHFHDRSDVVAPSNKIEEALLQIWKDVLQDGNVGIESKFFQIGGDSLKATQLIMKVYQEFHVELPIEKLYTAQTVKILANQLPSLERKEYKAIPKAAMVDSYPSSPLQKRIYYAWRIDPDSIAYNMPVAIKLKGKINPEKLQKCLQGMVMRHDAMRMAFHLADDQLRFRVSNEVIARLNCIECVKEKWDEKLRSLILPFNLAEGPLFRFFLLRYAHNNEYVLLLDFHHIISDGRSAYWFIDELVKMYNGDELPSLNVSFRDYVVWDRQNGDKANTSLKKYWLDSFSDEVPVLEMPCDFARPLVRSPKGKRLKFDLSYNISARLREISKSCLVTMHSLFFNLYNILLTKYSNQEDIVIGIPIQVRKHPDLQRVQGMFVNNLPIRNRIALNCSFEDLLKKTSQLIIEAIDHQDLAFDDLLNCLNLSSHAGRNPLFDTMFVYQSLEKNSRQIAEFEVATYTFDPGFSKFDISMEVLEDGDQISYVFEYSLDLFKDETILKLSSGFERMITKVIENPAIKIGDLVPISDEEFEDFTVTYNTTGKSDKPFIPIPELFEEQAKQYPDSIALEFNGKKFTYRDLELKANAIANALRNKSIGKGDLVGIHLRRSPELIAAILGIFKSGAAYLPLEADMPRERVKFILADSGCRFLINHSQVEDFELRNNNLLEIFDIDSLSKDTDNRQVSVCNNPTDLAY
ncbi:MAG: hypothetical protein C0490_15565, partial [Marivirga sp.]|nr:hypothetical protein [Marivirga sp.]